MRDCRSAEKRGYILNMSQLIEFEKNTEGPRLRICGQRIHHGASSLILTTICAAIPRTRLIAPLFLLGALHDRHDWRLWFALGDPQIDTKSLSRAK